jgi:tetratricopeptide (TPR) repeat protein
MMNHRRTVESFRTALVLLALVGSVAGGCQSGIPASSESSPRARLFEKMGGHRRSVTTASAEAQRFFDQGLTWAYAFNHDEAIVSFTRAAELDPRCAMAWWGVALCHGPHINNPTMPRERSVAAWEAIQKAIALQSRATASERALIRALEKRYSADPAADRAPLDRAYAAAMAEVWASHPNDADIGVLCAEAFMDLQPWDLWTREGEPKGQTALIVSTLEQAMRLNPDHPGALHLYIHAVEASRRPERAVGAADRLRRLVSAAGHLVHMPSHIDVRVGRWDQASDANERAIRADAEYRRLVPKQGFYHVYMAHNHHFLAYAAMMEGRFETALAAARAMIAGVPDEFLQTSAAMLDPYTAIEYQVLLRFGKWDQLLSTPAPDARLPVTGAMWRFARASALAAKGDVDGAMREQAEFRKAAAGIGKDVMMAINKAHDVLAIAEGVLAGEIAFRRGKIDDAVASLRYAAQLEDRLVYMEPPEWIQPVRHSLGAILFAAGRAEEAQKVYREDLNRWPENGWALLGLSRSLRELGQTGEADAFQDRFARAWRRADTKIEVSCLCVR